MLILIFILFLK